MDDAAIAAVRDLYGDLDIDGRVLDLCDGGADHFEVPPDALIAGTPDAYADGEFDDVVCCGNVELGTFVEVARVLKPGGRFVLTFVGGGDDAGRVRALRKAFEASPAFGGAESDLRTSLTGAGDRLWAVWAVRQP